jgi:hypothetical protein
MLHLNDTIKIMIDEKRYRTKYKVTCDTCGKDRGYQSKQSGLTMPNCRKCSKQNMSQEWKDNIGKSAQGRVPYNKGKNGVSDETSQKMSAKRKGVVPANKGIPASIEQKITTSCAVRGISIDQFDGFTKPIDMLEREKLRNLGLKIACFEREQYTCQICQQYGGRLNAHHLNSWKFFPDERFELSNLACLCNSCHIEFHKLYGNGKGQANTKYQFEEFKLSKLIT